MPGGFAELCRVELCFGHRSTTSREAIEELRPRGSSELHELISASATWQPATRALRVHVRNPRCAVLIATCARRFDEGWWVGEEGCQRALLGTAPWLFHLSAIVDVALMQAARRGGINSDSESYYAWYFYNTTRTHSTHVTLMAQITTAVP